MAIPGLGEKRQQQKIRKFKIRADKPGIQGHSIQRISLICKTSDSAQNHKNNIINIIKVEPEECTFTLRQREYEIRIDLKVKNRYVKTKFLLEYDYTSSKMEYIITYTHHDSLESMPWFKSEVKRIENENGYRYEFCYMGHNHEHNEVKFLIKNEFETIVMFEKDGSEDHYGYRLDFNTGNLEHYHTYPFWEYYAFFG